jgi:branched-chain amino acid transport system substrate-binding protein
MARIGILQEHPLPEPMMSEWVNAIQLTFDEAHETGLLKRPVDLIVRLADGLPNGDPVEVLRAWHELKAEGCIAILGPNSTDNARALAASLGPDEGVPSIAMCGTERWPSHWRFLLPAGSMPLEPLLLGRFLGKQGARTVAVFRDQTGLGAEYFENFVRVARDAGLTITHVEILEERQTEHLSAVERACKTAPDAVMYLGYGMSALNLSEEMATLGWAPLRVMTTAFEFVYFGPQYMRSFRGWVGCDQLDETNEVGQGFLDRYAARFGYRPTSFWPLMQRDMAQMLAIAVANAGTPSASYVRDALESVKLVAAAAGGVGTLMSFGPYQHTGWANPNYLVLREVAEDGKSTQLRARFQDL